MSDMGDTLIVNGEAYQRVTPPASGSRAVVVIDRGWIYAGDVTDYTRADGAKRIKLERVVWPRKWNGVWLDAVIADPHGEAVNVVSVPYMVDLPADAELYRIPVGDDWGL